MIKRLVKMRFRPEEVDKFKSLFNEQKEKIRSFPGCEYLELLQSMDDPQVFFTLSFWTEENALNAYRSSSLFKGTWAATKDLFDAKPEAWSTISQTILDINESNT